MPRLHAPRDRECTAASSGNLGLLLRSMRLLSAMAAWFCPRSLSLELKKSFNSRAGYSFCELHSSSWISFAFCALAQAKEENEETMSVLFACTGDGPFHGHGADGGGIPLAVGQDAAPAVPVGVGLAAAHLLRAGVIVCTGAVVRIDVTMCSIRRSNRVLFFFSHSLLVSSEGGPRSRRFGAGLFLPSECGAGSTPVVRAL